MEDDDKAQKSGEKFRKAQVLVVETINLNLQDEEAMKVFKLWKRKLDIYLQTLKANNEEKFNILIIRLGLNTYEYVDSANIYTQGIFFLGFTVRPGRSKFSRSAKKRRRELQRAVGRQGTRSTGHKQGRAWGAAPQPHFLGCS